MTQPVPGASFTVVPDEVEALAAELGMLAAELGQDADDARWAAGVFPVALSGAAGWSAGATATAWARLHAEVAARTSALGRSLAASAATYRAQDEALAKSVTR